MIIFDLDGTLADCEHRRHFVDPNKALENEFIPAIEHFSGDVLDRDRGNLYHKYTGEKWKPDWKSFYESCDKDKPIIPVINILRCHWGMMNYEMEIWSVRCESVREKTETWLMNNGALKCKLKMRPIGDNTPDEILKERWLDKSISEGKRIDFVFDDRPKVVRMWRRRGIFVFDCNQSGKEF